MLYRLVEVPRAQVANDAYSGSPLLNEFANDGWRLISIAIDAENGNVIAAMGRDDG